jgi:hypothetical protein
VRRTILRASRPGRVSAAAALSSKALAQHMGYRGGSRRRQGPLWPRLESVHLHPQTVAARILPSAGRCAEQAQSPWVW